MSSENAGSSPMVAIVISSDHSSIGMLSLLRFCLDADVDCTTGAGSGARIGDQSSVITRAIATRESVSLSRTTRTPWVLRPILEISSTEVRMSCPFWVTNTAPSPPDTGRTATTSPFLELVLMSIRPLPPRPCGRVEPSSERTR